ncbi:IS4 family transposase [Alicyclobacillus acidoterrestris]|uniref:IS4 family transposase n=3 Tax=Alicyclobacillus TaxID=29330 RepID=A0A9E6ZET9_ALIAG|nr:IS4 family transposase [Alicyclobacillus acidoterrestris]EPZ53165.1 hypothetical protein N007_01940 [Alicyclobacillus acidoterrestris ATCC 49025]UNO48522.1 IS4 family transposase [Alicyclobacillus acidoterrestris]UNO50121.1 IS4 family transposase [Alicyclobacillus acidoterrestris]UNO50131.1 IS4 family transposase [Alicyclobacillus acidoterrestris]
MGKHIIKSTLAEYLSPLNPVEMLREIKTLGLDRYTKKLDSITFLQLLVFAQLQQIDSLTSLSALLNENQQLQAELGLESISTSQLSRKLRQMDTKFPSSVFQRCVAQIARTVGAKKATQALKRMNLIDASTITMCVSQYPWAEFRQTKAGVKLHLRLVFENDLAYPDKEILTPAKPADRTQMDNLVVNEPDALNVFDRGYVDYQKFDEYILNGTRFVTRLRENASIMEVYEERPVAQDSLVVRDAVIRLGSKFRNMVHPTRWLEVLDSDGRRIMILTNDLTMDATEICDLYRNRWQIELFFKWIKQHLHVKKFYGKSENAVYNQLRIALITFCLLVLLRLRVKHPGRLLDVYKCVRWHWSEPFTEFRCYLSRPPTRASTGRKKVKTEEIFAMTLQQYIDEEIEHLESMVYDPI